jgi:hypothetical protein
VKGFLWRSSVSDGKMVKHIWPARNDELPKRSLTVGWMRA